MKLLSSCCSAEITETGFCVACQDHATPYNPFDETDALKWSVIAERMGKTRQWFYQRKNRNSVNGFPADFTPEELKEIAGQLRSVKEEINVILEYIAPEQPKRKRK